MAFLLAPVRTLRVPEGVQGGPGFGDGKGEQSMLELRPGCECCDRDLPPDSAEARICSFECTFCADCACSGLAGFVPTVDGELSPARAVLLPNVATSPSDPAGSRPTGDVPRKSWDVSAFVMQASAARPPHSILSLAASIWDSPSSRPAAKFTFQCTSDDRRRPLPTRSCSGLEITSRQSRRAQFVAGNLFFRERPRGRDRCRQRQRPVVPDLANWGTICRPTLWVECGDCSVGKLRTKLAVKCPEGGALGRQAILRGRRAILMRTMARGRDLRRNRYGILASIPRWWTNLWICSRERNTVHWFQGRFLIPPQFS